MSGVQTCALPILQPIDFRLRASDRCDMKSLLERARHNVGRPDTGTDDVKAKSGNVLSYERQGAAVNLLENKGCGRDGRLDLFPRLFSI